MSEYDFGISYIKGKENVVMDALSRRPRVFSLVPLKVNLRERVLTQLLGDSWYLKVTSAPLKFSYPSLCIRTRD
jgi:hypothetical protein